MPLDKSTDTFFLPSTGEQSLLNTSTIKLNDAQAAINALIHRWVRDNVFWYRTAEYVHSECMRLVLVQEYLSWMQSIGCNGTDAINKHISDQIKVQIDRKENGL